MDMFSAVPSGIVVLGQEPGWRLRAGCVSLSSLFLVGLADGFFTRVHDVMIGPVVIYVYFAKSQ